MKTKIAITVDSDLLDKIDLKGDSGNRSQMVETAIRVWLRESCCAPGWARGDLVLKTIDRILMHEDIQPTTKSVLETLRTLVEEPME